ncbi:MAG TPA: hypothetical protein PKE06_14795 [Flavilitoribacter sp.]|nr:hypothetical protein [Flavilitoribacter sp.]HMQ89856.1 hypothetical protein [Flavilitoribacter sp.]
MSFLKKIWQKKRWTTSRFGPAEFNFGVGESEIRETSISIRNYPFEPASVFPEKKVRAAEIAEIHPDQYPPTFRIGDELIFIGRESVEALLKFAERNDIPAARRAANWNWITEPFLDTEFDQTQQVQTLRLLAKNGILPEETDELRREIGRQLHKYNFDTMLWDWMNLGLADVLAAMHPSLGQEAFRNFYWKAMEIEQRKGKTS